MVHLKSAHTGKIERLQLFEALCDAKSLTAFVLYFVGNHPLWESCRSESSGPKCWRCLTTNVITDCCIPWGGIFHAQCAAFTERGEQKDIQIFFFFLGCMGVILQL